MIIDRHLLLQVASKSKRRQTLLSIRRFANFMSLHPAHFACSLVQYVLIDYSSSLFFYYSICQFYNLMYSMGPSVMPSWVQELTACLQLSSMLHGAVATNSGKHISTYKNPLFSVETGFRRNVFEMSLVLFNNAHRLPLQPHCNRNSHEESLTAWNY